MINIPKVEDLTKEEIEILMKNKERIMKHKIKYIKPSIFGMIRAISIINDLKPAMPSAMALYTAEHFKLFRFNQYKMCQLSNSILRYMQDFIYEIEIKSDEVKEEIIEEVKNIKQPTLEEFQHLERTKILVRGTADWYEQRDKIIPGYEPTIKDMLTQVPIEIIEVCNAVVQKYDKFHGYYSVIILFPDSLAHRNMIFYHENPIMVNNASKFMIDEWKKIVSNNIQKKSPYINLDIEKQQEQKNLEVVDKINQIFKEENEDIF